MCTVTDTKVPLPQPTKSSQRPPGRQLAHRVDQPVAPVAGGEAGGVDDVARAAERRRVGQLEVHQVVDRQPAGERGGEHVDPLVDAGGAGRLAS